MTDERTVVGENINDCLLETEDNLEWQWLNDKLRGAESLLGGQ
jgi:hypothetical protein